MTLECYYLGGRALHSDAENHGLDSVQSSADRPTLVGERQLGTKVTIIIPETSAYLPGALCVNHVDGTELGLRS